MTSDTNISLGSTTNNRASALRIDHRHNGTHSSTSKDVEGATPKIRGALALHSKNVTKKVNYDAFCGILGTYIMNKFKNGENIVEVTKNPEVDIITESANDNKPAELIDEKKTLPIGIDIKRNEVKDYVKGLKLLKSNLKKIYSLVYGNSTDRVKTMLKVDNNFEEKSKSFDHFWI